MIKTLKENLVFSNRFFQVYNNEVLFNEKNEGTHLLVEGTTSKDGIAVLPVLENGNIVLIKNFRYGANDWVYQVIKGGNGTAFKNIEEATKCVKEELEEEASIKTDKLTFLTECYENPAFVKTKCFAFIADNCQFVEQEIFAEDTEVIEEVLELDPFMVDEFLKDKKVCATTMYLIKAYQVQLLSKKI